MWARYLQLLSQRPIATKAVTATTLSAAGDAIAQAMEMKQAYTKDECLQAGTVASLDGGGGGGGGGGGFDGRRLFAFSVFGGAYTGVLNHYWFDWLAKRYPGTAMRPFFTKLFLQNGLLTPCGYLPLFYLSQALLLGQTAAELDADVRTSFWDTMKTTWAVWIPATAISFLWLPTRMHVPYISAVSLVWNIGLSCMYNAPNEPNEPNALNELNAPKEASAAGHESSSTTTGQPDHEKRSPGSSSATGTP